MGAALYRLTMGNQRAGREIIYAVEKILELEEEYVSLLCYEAFDQLRTAQMVAEHNYYESILDTLTDDNLIEIILKFEKGFLKIQSELKQIHEHQKNLMGDHSKVQLLEKQHKDHEKKITDKETEINRLSRETPGFWVRIFADEQPGIFKRFFLLFVNKKLIDEAKSTWTDYHHRNTLIAEVKGLKAIQQELKKESDFLTRKLMEQDRTQEYDTLSNHQQILQENFNKLKKQAGVLIPAKDIHIIETKIKKNEVQERRRDEDNELQFNW